MAYKIVINVKLRKQSWGNKYKMLGMAGSVKY